MSLSAGFGGAAQGASAGAAFGPWGAVIGGGLGLLAGSSAASSAKKQQRYVRQQLEESNRLLRIETSRGYAEIMKQQAYNDRATQEALQYIARATGKQRADISLQTAAADSIGASAAAVFSDLDAQSAEAQAKVVFQSQVERDNLNTSLESMLRGSLSQVNSQLPSSGSSSMSSLLGLGELAGTLYTSGAFSKLGGLGSLFGSSPSVNPSAPISPTAGSVGFIS